MSDIFLAYSSTDLSKAKAVAEALEREGWTVFWDQDIPPGKTWREVIGSELRAASCVVVLWSAQATTKRFVIEEAEEGDERGILVPALIEDIKQPLGFRSVQAARLVDWNGTERTSEYEKLVSRIKELLGDLVEVAAPLVMAHGAAMSDSTATSTGATVDAEQEPFVLRDIRRRLLARPDLFELERLRYEVEEFLESHPKDPEAQQLLHKISEAEARATHARGATLFRYLRRVYGGRYGRRFAAATAVFILALLLVAWLKWGPGSREAEEPGLDPAPAQSTDADPARIHTGADLDPDDPVPMQPTDTERPGFAEREEGEHERATTPASIDAEGQEAAHEPQPAATKSTPAPAAAPACVTDNLNPCILIEGGSFLMGDDVSSQHRVSISSFYLQEHEVTNAEYTRFVPSHPFPRGQERHPVTKVNWYEAMAYANWLGGALPTEAQWEFAARGEEGRTYPWGEEKPTSDRANYAESNIRTTTPVKSYESGATPQGIYDLSGNVAEWCSDWWGFYPHEEQVDPQGPATGTDRVKRGGFFTIGPRYLRCAYRMSDPPDVRSRRVGFRVAWSASGGP